MKFIISFNRIVLFLIFVCLSICVYFAGRHLSLIAEKNLTEVRDRFALSSRYIYVDILHELKNCYQDLRQISKSSPEKLEAALTGLRHKYKVEFLLRKNHNWIRYQAPAAEALANVSEWIVGMPAAELRVYPADAAMAENDHESSRPLFVYSAEPEQAMLVMDVQSFLDSIISRHTVYASEKTILATRDGFYLWNQLVPITGMVSSEVWQESLQSEQNIPGYFTSGAKPSSNRDSLDGDEIHGEIFREAWRIFGYSEKVFGREWRLIRCVPEADIVASTRQETASLLLLLGIVAVSTLGGSTLILLTHKRWNRDLVMQRQQLLAVDRLKDEFLASASHELRTPISAVIGYCELLMNENRITHQEDCTRLQALHRNSLALLNMINGILDMSKISAGKMDMVWECIDFTELFDELQDLCLPLIDNPAVTLCFQQRPGISEWVSDYLKLRQVLINLVSNAIKFTEQGEICVRVEMLAENKIKITVEDSGIGMTKKDQSQVFQQYYQVGEDTNYRLGGSGLGLTLVKEYMHMLQGELILHSEKGQGSRFELIFDLKNTQPITAVFDV